jgi:hypothetical protein
VKVCNSTPLEEAVTAPDPASGTSRIAEAIERRVVAEILGDEVDAGAGGFAFDGEVFFDAADGLRGTVDGVMSLAQESPIPNNGSSTLSLPSVRTITRYAFYGVRIVIVCNTCVDFGWIVDVYMIVELAKATAQVVNESVEAAKAVSETVEAAKKAREVAGEAVDALRDGFGREDLKPIGNACEAVGEAFVKAGKAVKEIDEAWDAGSKVVKVVNAVA